MTIRKSESAAHRVTRHRLADVAVSATGPAVDIAFDIAVYVALVVHIVRRWLDRGTATDRL